MRAADQVDVVGHRVVRGHERSLDSGSDADGRASRHADHRLMGQITVDFHVDVAAGEVIVIEAVHRYAIHRRPELVHCGGRDQVRVTQRKRLRQVV